MSNNKNIWFWFTCAAVVFALTLPILIQDAMFQDAVLYSCVSRNLSLGIGTFWFPQYSFLNIAGIPSFHEQPPLFFGIQAMFFKIMGDTIYVERFQTFLTILLNMFLIHKIWKLIFKNDEKQAQITWLPVFFWIIIPVCFWSYRGNMIENTMSVFDLAAVILFIKGIEKSNKQYLWMLGSGVLIFLASLTKGVPGLFPAVLPLIYWLVTRKISLLKSLSYFAICFGVPILIYGLLITDPSIRESLSIYVFKRLLGRIDVMPTADYRLEILWRLFTEMIPVLLIIAIVWFVLKFRKQTINLLQNRQLVYTFLLLGLAGSVPLTLTMVQKGWYLVPSFPYFAIGFALIISPWVSIKISKINVKSKAFKRFKLISLALLLGVLVFTAMQKGKISRESDTLLDVYTIGKVVPRFSVISVPKTQYDEYDFVLQGFLVRYFNISIDPNPIHDYYLQLKDTKTSVPEGFQKTNLTLNKYELYQKHGIQ